MTRTWPSAQSVLPRFGAEFGPDLWMCTKCPTNQKSDIISSQKPLKSEDARCFNFHVTSKLILLPNTVTFILLSFALHLVRFHLSKKEASKQASNQVSNQLRYVTTVNFVNDDILRAHIISSLFLAIFTEVVTNILSALYYKTCLAHVKWLTSHPLYQQLLWKIISLLCPLWDCHRSKNVFSFERKSYFNLHDNSFSKGWVRKLSSFSLTISFSFVSTFSRCVFKIRTDRLIQLGTLKYFHLWIFIQQM